MQVHIVATFVLGAPDIKVDLHFVTLGNVVEKAGLVLDALELDLLRILAVHRFEDELALGKSARKRLHFENGVDFALDFKSRHGGKSQDERRLSQECFGALFLSENPVVALATSETLAIEVFEQGHRDATGGAEELAQVGGGGGLVLGEVVFDEVGGFFNGGCIEHCLFVEGNDLSYSNEKGEGPLGGRGGGEVFLVGCIELFLRKSRENGVGILFELGGDVGLVGEGFDEFAFSLDVVFAQGGEQAFEEIVMGKFAREIIAQGLQGMPGRSGLVWW